MEIRGFRTIDTAKMIELFQHTVHTICSHDYSPEQLDTWAPRNIDSDRWITRFTESYTVVAEADGLIVGFANLEDDGCVDMLYVAATMQSLGIATKLYTALEEEALRRGLKRLYSDVSLTARKFFLAKGFSVEKEYSKQVGHVIFPNAIMAKQIK